MADTSSTSKVCKALTYLKEKLTSKPVQREFYPEYNFEGKLNEHHTKASSIGEEFVVKVDFNKADSSADPNTLLSLLYHAFPQSSTCGENPRQAEYDPWVRDVYTERQDKNMNIELHSSSKNPRVQETLKKAQTNLDKIVADIYALKVQGI